MSSAVNQVNEQVARIASAAAANLEKCGHMTAEVGELVEGVELSSANLQDARGRVNNLLELGESLVELTAASGCETVDTPFIRALSAAAQNVSEMFESAVARGEIALADLFDENYRPIPNTNPQQYVTRFTEFTDRVMPPIQEALLNFDPKVVFCAAVDRNGYLPTHNKKFSQPQGADPAWNAANCRNRRIFNDRTGLAAGRNQKPFLLQTYRRDMGGGAFVLMKDLSVPI